MNRKMFYVFLILCAYSNPLQATETLSLMQSSENPLDFMDKVISPAGKFDRKAAREFLNDLSKEVAQQGFAFDLNAMVEEAIQTMEVLGRFSEEEIKAAQVFFSYLLDDEKFEIKKYHARGSSVGKKKAIELVLPDKMAGGFMCIIGGAILCVLPFPLTQGIGTGLICTGAAIILESSAQGDRPYYLDTETGEKRPVSGPSIGIGQTF